MISAEAFIHPKAHVENSTVGARSRVWQFASVIRGAVVGDDCNVAACATLDGAKIGDRCIIAPGAFLVPGFMSGDDCFFGPGVTVCNDRWPTADKIGFDITPFQNGHMTVLVGSRTSIGANAVVLPGIVVGTDCMIAAGAVVDKDVPDGHLLKRGGALVKLDGRIPKRMIIRAGHAA